MNTPRKHPAPEFPRKADWRWKDFLTWGIVLAIGLLALLVLWTPLMLAPLQEMAGAFIRLHQEP
jgi:flagellar biosynthesis/type III secretory pathway M-ring protein FliF/YscJ